MLVLSRRIGQRLRLVVGEQTIWVTVVSIEPLTGNVRLGIEANRQSVVIDREEIISDGPAGWPQEHPFPFGFEGD